MWFHTYQYLTDLHLEQRVIAGALHLAHTLIAAFGGGAGGITLGGIKVGGITLAEAIASALYDSTGPSPACNPILSFLFEESLHLPSKMYTTTGNTTSTRNRAGKSACLGSSMSPSANSCPTLFTTLLLLLSLSFEHPGKLTSN